MLHHLGLKGRAEVLLRASWALYAVWYISYIYPPINARKMAYGYKGIMKSLRGVSTWRSKHWYY
jgi:hypothetical protein